MAVKLINKELQQKVKENDGYCICSLVKEPDTKCMCKEFRDTVPTKDEPVVTCHCGVYTKTYEE